MRDLDQVRIDAPLIDIDDAVGWPRIVMIGALVGACLWTLFLALCTLSSRRIAICAEQTLTIQAQRIVALRQAHPRPPPSRFQPIELDMGPLVASKVIPMPSPEPSKSPANAPERMLGGPEVATVPTHKPPANSPVTEGIEAIADSLDIQVIELALGEPEARSTERVVAVHLKMRGHPNKLRDALLAVSTRFQLSEFHDAQNTKMAHGDIALTLNAVMPEKLTKRRRK